jgi:hypothetical protein
MSLTAVENLIEWKMQRHLEQRYSVKFCVKLKKTATQTFRMIQEDYQEEVMSRGMVFM